MTVRRFGVLLAALACLLVTAIVAPVPAGAAEPTVDVESVYGPNGDFSVRVRGAGFTPGAIVAVAVCGNRALRGSADCDQTRAANAGADTDGRFVARVVQPRPPVPCPCVVHVESAERPEAIDVAIAVPGTPTASPEQLAAFPSVTRRVEIDGLRVERSGGEAAEWFGAGADRTLVFDVVNTGSVTVHAPPLTVLVGRGDTPSGLVDGPERVETLLPGQRTTVRVPVRLEPLSFGSYTIAAHVDGFDPPVGATTTTDTRPWGLVIVPLVIVVQLALLAIRNRVRRRLTRDARPPEPVIDLRDDRSIVLEAPSDDVGARRARALEGAEP